VGELMPKSEGKHYKNLKKMLKKKEVNKTSKIPSKNFPINP